MKTSSTAFKLLCWFCDHPGVLNAKTPYDLAIAIEIHPGTEIYQRVNCDLRKTLGLDIDKVKIIQHDGDGHYRRWFGYYLPQTELHKARLIRDTIRKVKSDQSNIYNDPSTAPYSAEDNRKVPANPSPNSGESPSSPELHGLNDVPAPSAAAVGRVMYCLTPLGLVATDGKRNWIVEGTEP